MRPDHLIDAPSSYTLRLRKGATRLVLAGVVLAGAALLSMMPLPTGQQAPLVRTLLLVLQLAVWGIAGAWWVGAWWRLSDARVESLPTRGFMGGSLAVRGCLLLFMCSGVIAWCAALVRAILDAGDASFYELVLNTTPAFAALTTVIAGAATIVAGQAVVRSLYERTTPSKLPLYPVALGAVSSPLPVMFLPANYGPPFPIGLPPWLVKMACLFAAAQGAVLVYRISRVRRALRKAEVDAARAARSGTLEEHPSEATETAP